MRHGQRGRGSAFCSAVMRSGPIGSGAQPWSCSHTKSNAGCAPLWQPEQLPPNRFSTSAPPRDRIFVPVGDTSREKNSQSFVEGLKPAARLTIASWGTSCMMVPTG